MSSAIRPSVSTATPAGLSSLLRSERWGWTAYGAAAWALLFAAQSLAAAIVVMAGSAFGADTFGADIAHLARAGDAGFIATLWLAALAKALAAALALAPIRPWGRRLPRRALTITTTVLGALVLLYGVVNLAEHALMKTGATAIPHGLGSHALPWHLWLWDPYWILGGLLFLLAARTTGRPTAKRSSHGSGSKRRPMRVRRKNS
jgi:hypothetical protein